MPIHVLEGVPRSGKSYEAVSEHIIPALRSGRAVVTDIPLNVGELNRLLKTEVDDLVYQLRPGVRSDGRLYRPFDNLADYTWSAPEVPTPGARFWERERDSGKQRPLLVIDEAHEVLGTSTSDKGGPSVDIINWFAMHGHHGYDVVLLTQDHMLLNTGIRRRIEQRFRFVRLEALGSTSRYIRLRYSGQGKGAIRRELRKYNKRIFRVYASMTGGGAISEKRTRPIWLNLKFVAFVAFIGFVVFKVSTHEGGILPGVREQSAQAPASSAGAARPAAPTLDAQISTLEAQIKQERLTRELECVRTGSPEACRTASAGSGGLLSAAPGAAWSRGLGPGYQPAPVFVPKFPFDGWRWHLDGFIQVGTDTSPVLLGVAPGETRFQRVPLEALQAVGWAVEPLGAAGYRLAYAEQANVVVLRR